jgi:hypothetical protein
MAVRFFGQFLIDQGEVDADQVRIALDLMEDENPTIGEIAIDEGFLSARQAALVSAEQRVHYLAFGDLAVEMGFLDPTELEQVLFRQRSQRVLIGDALARLGFVEWDRLGTLLDAYKVDQASYQVGARNLPEALERHRAPGFVIELLPEFLMRFAQIHAKVGDVVPFSSGSCHAEVKVSVSIEGASHLLITLVSDRSFAEALAVAASGLGTGARDADLIVDGVGEFLNVLVGNAIAASAREAHRFDLGPPEYDADPGEGWAVGLAVGVGAAALLFAVA